MEINILTQPKLYNKKDYSLGEHLNSLLLSKKPKFTDATFFFGLVKDSAFDKIYESLKSFILNGGNACFYLGQDKKSTIKKVINSLLELGAQVYLFKGEGKDFISDFQYKSVMFNSPKKATLLLTSGNFSTSGLFDGYNVVTEFLFDLTKDKEEFFKTTSNLLPDSVKELFEEITRTNFDEIFNIEKEIPSIEEFTHKDIEEYEPIITVVDDIDVEIDDNVDFLVAQEFTDKPKKEKIGSQEQQKKVIPEPLDAIEFENTKYYMEEDDGLDIENMLFLNSSKTKETKTTQLEESLPSSKNDLDTTSATQTKIVAKTTNLSKTSIFMIELPKITKKGESAGEIKIPTYLRDLIPGFWGWPKEYSLDKNSLRKLRTCTFKIIDTKNVDSNITDNNVSLFQKEGENSFVILSSELIKLDLEENDIMRLIKTESADGYYYTCEIIRKNANEYPIWEQFCTTPLKGSKRKYGMM
ncbi:MAG: hypothetical protein E7314_07480 [Clostridiales bacterium]|nr:hypothetical protein [Clostridiales bacterium]